MNNFIMVLMLLCLSTYCVAGAGEVDLGDSQERLIEVEGKADEVSELEIKDKVFFTHYYGSSETSYVIDKEKNIVCEIAKGKTEGYCYPCDYGPTAGTCP